MEMLHTLTGMGSAALVAAVCLTQLRLPEFPTWGGESTHKELLPALDRCHAHNEEHDHRNLNYLRLRYKLATYLTHNGTNGNFAKELFGQ